MSFEQPEGASPEDEAAPLSTEELRALIAEGRAQQIVDRLTELEREAEDKRTKIDPPSVSAEE